MYARLSNQTAGESLPATQKTREKAVYLLMVMKQDFRKTIGHFAL